MLSLRGLSEDELADSRPRGRFGPDVEVGGGSNMKIRMIRSDETQYDRPGRDTIERDTIRWNETQCDRPPTIRYYTTLCHTMLFDCGS